MIRSRGYWILVLGLILMLLGGCGGGETPAATVTPTRTLPPTATALVIPPTATPTATPLPTPPPTAAPVDVVTPFPPDVNPLTGLKVADPTMLDHSPLAIKISNSAEVRPQSGLNSADLIFEHYAEGGITRFTAIFYGAYPERVGSVRSGRLIDLEIPAMYQASFAYSGSSAGVKERYRKSDLFPERIMSPDFGVGAPAFYRVPREGLAFEHTLFADPMALRQLAIERGVDKRPNFPKLMAFSEGLPAVKDIYDVKRVYIDYRASKTQWDYDPASGRWLRTTAGVLHTDYLTGEPLSFANVILLYANHLETDILEDTWGGGHMSIEIQVWGQGPALVLRDGKMIPGFWQRGAREEMLTFIDGEGKPLPLKPGNTWFEVVPLETQSSEEAPGQYRFLP
ncbi:MAG: putative lipoprotein YerB precursor [Chloroflexi bacterium ADurb.Bin222]|nr:MAG: putative lipoprotein YerB precursor [Chloroflexi bacterium ADurb.Bin222]